MRAGIGAVDVWLTAFRPIGPVDDEHTNCEVFIDDEHATIDVGSVVIVSA